MDISHLLDDLNEVQREAVAAAPGNMLIIAGAGSGKTRVLTRRIAYLIETGQASPLSVLAVTFTNKAAHEMRGRIEKLISAPTRGMWVSTFHSLAHRLLRTHWREAGLPQGFQILDGQDQYRTVRNVLKAMDLDETRWPPRQVQWFINSKKDEGHRPKHLDGSSDAYQERMIRIYQAYEEACQRGGLVDFAELLLRAYELWLGNEQLLAHYQHRFHHILVDEFQDTNAVQYAWLRLLSTSDNTMFVVGDDDQSIYGWRGARIENIQRFTSDYSSCKTLRLEQNYRSTGTILTAANTLIANNDGRLGKNLWTSGEEGEPVLAYNAFNDLDEARYIVEECRRWQDKGCRRQDIALLYRSNAQSRVLEEALIAERIPYRVYGGLRFFERAEVKNAMAYLRLMINRDDDASFERVVNLPTRGIGARSLMFVRDCASENNLSLWAAAHKLIDNKILKARAANAIMTFFTLVDSLADAAMSLELHEQVEHVLAQAALMDHYRREKSEKAQMRVENLEELVTAARQFNVAALEYDDDMDPLSAFLAHAALEAGEGQADEWEDCVQLMTLHSAKGLEFPVVFMCGLEEGLFPHQLSIDEPGRLEEERRLCYVGMTRAMRQLYMTSAESRRLHGNETYNQRSRFIDEIPEDLVNEVRMTRQVKQTAYASDLIPAFDSDHVIGGLKLGQRVMHNSFGEGIVLNYEGQGSHARVQVNFDQLGSKWLVLAYANLQSL